MYINFTRHNRYLKQMSPLQDSSVTYTYYIDVVGSGRSLPQEKWAKFTYYVIESLIHIFRNLVTSVLTSNISTLCLFYKS